LKQSPGSAAKSVRLQIPARSMCAVPQDNAKVQHRHAERRPTQPKARNSLPHRRAPRRILQVHPGSSHRFLLGGAFLTTRLNAVREQRARSLLPAAAALIPSTGLCRNNWPFGPPNSCRRLAIQRCSAAPWTRKIFPSATTSNVVATVGTRMREGSIAACWLLAVVTYKCAAS